MAELGIENLKKGAEVIVDLMDLTGDVLHDGVNLNDLPKAVRLPEIVTKATDIKDVIKEATDTTNDELNELEGHIKAYVASKIPDVEDDFLEETAQDVMLMLIPAIRTINRFKSKN